MESNEALAARLGHRFADPARLSQALTHRSAGGANNERLEFLGDAVLGLLVAEELFHLRPRDDEGQLTRLRASLVRRETLAELARELSLGDHLELGGGELKSGGYRRDSVLANAFEAIIGAIYLDGGLEEVRRVLQRLFSSRLDALPADGLPKDPKTRLQEHLQARSIALPEYLVTQVSGADHRRHYRVECRVEGIAAVLEGVGASRRKAEQAAAAQALAALGIDR